MKKKKYLDKYITLEECLSTLQKNKGLKPLKHKIKFKPFDSEVKTWKHFCFEIANYCYDEDPKRMHQMAKKEDKYKFLSNFRNDDNYKKVGKHVFINLGYNTIKNMQNAKEMLTEFDIADDYKIKFKVKIS